MKLPYFTLVSAMEGIDVSTGQTVLLLWSGQSPTEDLQETVTDLQKRVQDTGRVQVEHIDRLSLGLYYLKGFTINSSR